MTKKINTKLQIGAAITASIAFIGIFIILFGQAERWIGLSLINHLWFINVFLLSITGGVVLFSYSNSSARIKGKISGSTFELLGPSAFSIVVLFIGFQLAPAPQSDFDFTLYVELSDGSNPLQQRGKIKLKLGDNPAVKPIGSLGEVRFNNIAGRFREQNVRATLLEGFPYLLVQSSKTVTLTGESATLIIEPQVAKLTGRVETINGKAISGAQVRVQNEVTTTAEDGRFSLPLFADMSEIQRLVEVDAQGFKSSRLSFVLNGEPITIQLKKAF